MSYFANISGFPEDVIRFGHRTINYLKTETFVFS